MAAEVECCSGTGVSDTRRMSLNFRRPSLQSIRDLAGVGAKPVKKAFAAAKRTATDTMSPSRRGSHCSSAGAGDVEELSQWQIFGSRSFERSPSDLTSNRSSRRASGIWGRRKSDLSPRNSCRVAELSPKFHVMKPYLHREDGSQQQQHQHQWQSSPSDCSQIGGRIRSPGPIRATIPMTSMSSTAGEGALPAGSAAAVGLSRCNFGKSEPGKPSPPMGGMSMPKGMPPLPPRPKNLDDDIVLDPTVKIETRHFATMASTPSRLETVRSEYADFHDCNECSSEEEFVTSNEEEPDAGQDSPQVPTEHDDVGEGCATCVTPKKDPCFSKDSRGIKAFSYRSPSRSPSSGSWRASWSPARVVGSPRGRARD